MRTGGNQRHRIRRSSAEDESVVWPAADGACARPLTLKIDWTDPTHRRRWPSKTAARQDQQIYLATLIEKVNFLDPHIFLNE